YFFFQYGLLLESALTIWIHGTIEIASIIIAGGAGILAGNSILFPGTYTRMDSFRKGMNQGLKIVIGLIPLFIIAGFLESFVTRLFDMPYILKGLIIGASLYFVLFYFVFYPIKVNKNVRNP
ncbi:MAG: stage II sporulation protein M, partial [Cyclobacteriaceae bacterium]|nr:stage II sporulation protein M [Cyclobacteriaceae bacterium]